VTEKEEREFWEAPLRRLTPEERARIEAGARASEDTQADMMHGPGAEYGSDA
jgi:hypothetical protein